MVLTPKLKPKTTVPAAGINLGAIGDMLGNQAKVSTQRTTRQAEELKVAEQQQQITGKARRDALAINDQARSDAGAIRSQQLEILDGTYQQIQKAETAMKLSDSDNPMDRLSLWFLQQQDGAYTKEGNTARLAYLQNASAALGTIDVVQQAGYNEQIQRTQELLDMELESTDDRLTILKLQEAQGQELIDAEIQNQAARLGVLQNQNAMQANAMVNLTDDQIISSIQLANASPTQSTNVGGVELSLAQLNERKNAIDDRKYNETVLQNNLADQVLLNLPADRLLELKKEADASKDRTVVIEGVKIRAGRIDDRIYDVNNRALQDVQNQYNMNTMQEGLVQKAQQRILNGMQMPEIEAIIQNGFKDGNGIAYDQTMVRATRDQKFNDNQQAAINSATLSSMTSPVSPAAQATQQIDSITAALPAGSPALSALNQSKQALSFAATLLSSGDAATIQVGQQMVAAAQESVQSTINSEAKRLSAGDKAVEEAYKSVLTGQSIPPEVVEAELAEKVKKGEPVGRWLSGENRAVFTNAYNTELYALQQESMMSGMSIDKAELKNQAATAAMSQVLNSIAAPISDQLMLMQVQTPGNPLHGIVSTTDFAAMMSNADRQGIEAYIAGAQPNADDAAKIRAGSLIPPDLMAAQNARLYMALERKKPGLGDAYANWWGGEGRSNMVQQYMSAAMTDARNDFTKMSQLSLVMPHLEPALGSYGNAFAQGKQDVYAAEIQKQHAEYISFGNNPQSKQVFLLEQTAGLTSQEKQIGMQQIVQPILDLGRASGMENQDDLTRFVETQLQSFEPANPQAKAVLRKMMSGRDAALKVIDDFIAINGGSQYSTLGSTGILARQNSMQQMESSTSLPWYKDMLANGISTSGPAMNRGMK